MPPSWTLVALAASLARAPMHMVRRRWKAVVLVAAIVAGVSVLSLSLAARDRHMDDRRPAPRTPLEAASRLEDLAGEVARARAAIKLYVYDLSQVGHTHRFQDVDCAKVHWDQGAFYMYRTEDMVPRILAANVEVVANAADANAFLVPHNATCYTHSLIDTMGLYPSAANVSATYLEPLLRAVIERFPYFNASQGADHLYVFIHDHATFMFAEPVRAITSTGIRIQYYGARGANRTLYNHRDVVIPQLANLALAGRAAFPPQADGHVATTTKASQRKHLAVFTGTIHPDRAYSQGVRQDLLRWYANDSAMQPPERQIHIVQGSLKNNYSAALGASTFGLCPGGWAQWSPRLFDTMSQATIPVIMADGVVEPFEAYLDWREFSVKLRNNRTAELRDILVRARNDSAKLDTAQARLQAVAPYLLWSECTLMNCKPCDLLILALCERLRLCTPTYKRGADASPTDGTRAGESEWGF